MMLAAAPPTAANQRVMSLNLCGDQMVLYYPHKNRLLSVSHLAHDATLSPMHEKARDLKTARLDFESILANQPSHVILARHHMQTLAPFAKRHDITLIPLDIPNSPKSWIDFVQQLTKYNIIEGNSVRQDIEKTLKNIKKEGENLEQKTIIFLAPRGFALGIDHLAVQWSVLAGFTPKIKTKGWSTKINYEQLIADPPDVLVMEQSIGSSISTRTLPENIQNLLRSQGTVIIEQMPSAWTCPGPWGAEFAVKLQELHRK